jgi:hypothetical protein
MKNCMVAAVLILASAPAWAQATWIDPTGRISFDLAGTGWALLPRERTDNNIILNIVPEGALKGDEITRICALTHTRQPAQRLVTQQTANDGTKLAHEIDIASELSVSRDVDPGILIQHDGVTMQEVVSTEANPDGGQVHKIVREFMLAADESVDFVSLTCMAHATSGEQGIADATAMLGRLRISAESR